MGEKARRLVLLGPPGAGKGTQAKLVSQELDLPQVSTGDILRESVREGRPLGKKAESYMRAGELVPDDLILALMEEVLGGGEAENGFILDGFPRTKPQAEGLDLLLGKLGKGLERVVDVRVDTEVIVGRLVNRRSCPEDGSVYNLVERPPRERERCDLCGATLVSREDDREETVRHRLDVYEEQAEVLRTYYGDKGLLRTVDGSRPVEEVFQGILASLS